MASLPRLGGEAEEEREREREREIERDREKCLTSASWLASVKFLIGTGLAYRELEPPVEKAWLHQSVTKLHLSTTVSDESPTQALPVLLIHQAVIDGAFFVSSNPA